MGYFFIAHPAHRPPGHLKRVFRRGVRQDNGELLTAVAGYQVVGTQRRRFQHISGDTQAGVASYVATGVVVTLKVVDIEQDQRNGFSGNC